MTVPTQAPTDHDLTALALDAAIAAARVILDVYARPIASAFGSFTGSVGSDMGSWGSVIGISMGARYM